MNYSDKRSYVRMTNKGNIPAIYNWHLEYKEDDPRYVDQQVRNINENSRKIHGESGIRHIAGEGNVITGGE